MRSSRGAGQLPRGKVVPLDDRRARRRQNPDRAPTVGASPSNQTGITVTVHAGVPVVSCDGHLGADTVQDCAREFAQVVRLRPRTVVIDLSRANVDAESVPVLGLVRHFTTRHGIRLALAAVPPRGLDVLRQFEVAQLYEVFPTLPLAVGAAVAQSHRSLPRSQSGH
jgi:hypothetical protein